LPLLVEKTRWRVVPAGHTLRRKWRAGRGDAIIA